jgi:hypothetical protein
MRFRLAGGLDLMTAALLLGGAVLVAAAIIAIVSLLLPTPPAPAPEPATTARATIVPGARPAAALPPDRVAAVLYVNAGIGAGAAVRGGDRIDVLGYFSSSATQTENTTRTILQDVLVLSKETVGSNVALTLALHQSEALLINETQALGVRPFVTLPALRPESAASPAMFTDSDLAARLAEPR